jgi:hypothetical protein
MGGWDMELVSGSCSMEDSQASGAELSLQHTHFQYKKSEVTVVTIKITLG